MKMHRSLIRRTTLAAFAICCLSLPLAADGFGEGSFEDGSGGTQQPAGTGSGGGGFDDGSFVDGSGSGGTQVPAQEQAEVPGGSGGFDEGSFDDGTTPPQDTVADQTEPGGLPGGDDFDDGSFFPDNEEETANVVDDTRPTPEPERQQPEDVRPPDNNGPSVDPQIIAMELRDFGVPPQNTLRQGQFHAHTPTAVPGGKLVTTDHLLNAMNGGVQMVLIDVLGSGYGLPNSYTAPELASAGSFNDRTQQRAAQWLRQITGGNPNVAIVIYCSDPMCWLSYNASLRTIAAGYGNVYWYRGGIRAWEMAGLRLQPSAF